MGEPSEAGQATPKGERSDTDGGASRGGGMNPSGQTGFMFVALQLAVICWFAEEMLKREEKGRG
jgi:hypothetical protein